MTELLRSFEQYALFAKGVEQPPEGTQSCDVPYEANAYLITIDYRTRPSRMISSSFDKNGLPDDYPAFVEMLLEQLQYCVTGEIFDPKVYLRELPRPKEYLYCSVEFENGGTQYFYIADHDGYRLGDEVLVPVGADDHLAVARIVQMRRYPADKTPYPVEHTKHIEEKYTADERSNPKEDTNLWCWCLVGNISPKHGKRGGKRERGTDYYRAGAKVYISIAQWGKDRRTRVTTIGKPRGEDGLMETTMDLDQIENFHMEKVRDPDVLDMMQNSIFQWWGNEDKDRDSIRYILKKIKKEGNKARFGRICKKEK